MQKNVPIERNTVQGGSRHVVRYRVVIDYRDIRERIVVKKRKGGHVEKLQARSAENSDPVRALIQKPEENLDSCTRKTSHVHASTWEKLAHRLKSYTRRIRATIRHIRHSKH